MRRPAFIWGVAVLTGLAVLATSCSSSTSSAPTTTVLTHSSTNTGLCKLVGASSVATALGVGMNVPKTIVHGATTQCGYSAKAAPGKAILIRYDTGSNASTFASSREVFERRGLKLGPISGLGDQAYYFSDHEGGATVATVVLISGRLQILITGTGSLDQIGSIARYALSQYNSTYS